MAACAIVGYNRNMPQATAPRTRPQLSPLYTEREIYLSVIIPAYNEERRIGKTLRAIAAYLSQQPFASEVIVVDNASTDNTTGAARAHEHEFSRLTLLNEERKGKGDAIRAGMLAASGRVRLFTDADNSTDISHFDKMRPLFNQGYDVVICSRDAKDVAGATQAVPQAWHKRMLGNIGNLFIQLVAVPGIWDTQCGFKAFRQTAAERIFSAARIEKFGFDVEALALARRFGYRIGIVPAYWVNDAESRVSLKSYLEVFWEVARVRYYLLTGAYDERAPIRHESF